MGIEVNDNYNAAAAAETLKYMFAKSNVTGMDFIPEHIVIHEGADKTTSSSMGAIMKPCEEHPDGAIVLYMDAILDYANYIGKDFLHIAGKVMFVQAHNLLSYKKKEKFNFPKAETFANHACKKLMNKGIFKYMPPVFYPNVEDQSMKYQIMLRTEWIKKWTGMELAQVAEALETK